jgi:hypothetical protein
LVKVAFIVEGATEKVLVDSSGFRAWCGLLGIEIAEPVIDAKGGGNLLPEYVDAYLDQLRGASPDKIVVMTDLETSPDPALVRERIAHAGLDHVFIAVKAVEAWFLADSMALARWLERDHVETAPEETEGMPWNRLKELAVKFGVRGPGASKPVFAKRFTYQYGFELTRAAEHPQCPSARELRDVLQGWGVGRVDM